MPLFNIFLLGFLLALLWAGLLLARWASTRQSEQYSRLYQLTVLERRSQQLWSTYDALHRLEADAEVLGLFQQLLRSDLQRIRTLDPARTEIEQQLQKLDSDARSSRPQSGSPAVATEAELKVTHRHIQQALSLLTRLYRDKRISASQCQMARDRLQTHGIRVTVDSCLLMAQQAVEQEDSLRALSCFQRAERLLTLKGLSAQEKEQKKQYLHAERERLFNKTVVGAGSGLQLP